MNYSTADAALALGVGEKRLDNILNGPARSLLRPGTQGSARALTEDIITRVAIALLVHRDLSVPLKDGIALAGHLLESDRGEVAVGTLASVRFNIPRLRAVLRQSLADAVQDRIPVRRGRRPMLPGKEGRGTSL